MNGGRRIEFENGSNISGLYDDDKEDDGDGNGVLEIYRRRRVRRARANARVHHRTFEKIYRTCTGATFGTGTTDRRWEDSAARLKVKSIRPLKKKEKKKSTTRITTKRITTRNDIEEEELVLPRFRGGRIWRRTNNNKNKKSSKIVHINYTCIIHINRFL